MRHLLLALVLIGCASGADQNSDDTDAPEPLDLTVRLGDDEVRAGVISQPEARIGGLAGEGQLGDVLLINDRARFVVQGVRDGGGLAGQAGGVIDADVVRADGEPDLDLVTEWVPMLDLGHMPQADLVEVVDDGVESGTAVVVVAGTDSLMDYLVGSLENAVGRDAYDIGWQTTYTLEAGSPLLKVETTVVSGSAHTVAPGDVLMDVPGVSGVFVPGIGRTDAVPQSIDWVATVEHGGRVALGMFDGTADADTGPSASLQLLNFLLSVSSLYGPAVDLPAEGSYSWTRYWGVARDVGTLTDAWTAELGTPTRSATATVMSADGPVEGARVTVLVDGAPWTLAWSSPSGEVSVQVPEGGAVRFVADGSGDRVIDDLPQGAGEFAAMVDGPARDRTLASIRDGAAGRRLARGFGRAEADEGESLMLAVPGRLVVRDVAGSDALPFEVQVRAAGGITDDAFAAPSVSGLASLAWALDGDVSVDLEPGEYDVLVHRGARWEVHQASVTLTSGETVSIDATNLVAAYDTPGWMSADTHSHAAPSSDGKVSTSDRVLGMAAAGVQLYFGTEHDSVADAAPLVDALGVADVLRAVTAVEVSPLLRGHANVFPVVSDPAKPNGGAWRWWLAPVETTEQHFRNVRTTHPDAVVQINHPFSPGMPSIAGWSEGVVENADFWYDGFEALEVVKGTRDARRLALYFDLIRRGYAVAPMGNTDAHEHLSNDIGLNLTWMRLDAQQPSDVTDADIAAVVAGGHVVASNGPFLSLSVDPGSTLTETTTIDVQALSPSWMPVDRLILWRDGEQVGVIEDSTGSFLLDPDVDAVFTIACESDASMAPLGGHAAFAVSGPLWFDVAGDGWDAPSPPLVIGAAP